MDTHITVFPFDSESQIKDMITSSSSRCSSNSNNSGDPDEPTDVIVSYKNIECDNADEYYKNKLKYFRKLNMNVSNIKIQMKQNARCTFSKKL